MSRAEDLRNLTPHTTLSYAIKLRGSSAWIQRPSGVTVAELALKILGGLKGVDTIVIERGGMVVGTRELFMAVFGFEPKRLVGWRKLLLPYYRLRIAAK